MDDNSEKYPGIFIPRIYDGIPGVIDRACEVLHLSLGLYYDIIIIGGL